MKKLKVLSITLLAVILSMSLASCTLLEAVINTNAEDSKAAVTGFLDAFSKMEIKNASAFLENSEADDIPFDNLDDAKKQLLEELSSGSSEMAPYVDKLSPLLDLMFNKMLGGMKYTIADEPSVEGGVYTYTVDFTSYDFTELGNVISKALQNVDYSKIGTDLANSGTITATTSTEDAMNIIFDAVVAECEGVIEDTFKDINPETVAVKFAVEKIDGKWLITDDSDLDAFDNIFG